MADFDLRTTDIPTGLSVIEASAGTGKTWTIAHLLPRLLVDGVVNDIGEVVLVTFTDDAARELGERTRRQLAALAAHAGAGTQPGEREEGLRILLDRLAALDAPTREAAVLRLRLALDESDQLAVSTIHSFCKQVLGSEGFLCGMPAGFEILPDPAELKADAVKDTWRTDLAADPLLAAVAALGGWSVENDLRAWQRLTQRPSTSMDPAPPSLPEARHQVAQAIAAVKAARADLRRLQKIASWRPRDPERFGSEAWSGVSDATERLARVVRDAGPATAPARDLSRRGATGGCGHLVSPVRRRGRDRLDRCGRIADRGRGQSGEGRHRHDRLGLAGAPAAGRRAALRSQPAPPQRRHLRRLDSASA